LPKREHLPRLFWDKDDLKKKADGQYTHKPLVIRRLGGRDPVTGRKVNQHIGGGVKFDYFIIDYHRRGPIEENQTYDERVIEVRRDPNRSSHIALVAGSRGKRWILATENMKAGQIISTSGFIPNNPVIGIEGNAYPLGALAIGTKVNSVERYIVENPTYPGDDSEVLVCLAGSCAEVVRRQGDYVVIRMSYGREFAIHKECMATVGRLSHADVWSKQFGSAQMHRRFGYKMSSGLFHKKDGYCGRKVRRPPPVTTLDEPPPSPKPLYSFTLTKEEQSGLRGNAKNHHLIQYGYNNGVYFDDL
uniref:Ribosomal_L2_C domain-containing protein n=1 Tax=Dracunculus medinensis TaxID=318479 RepID=A0A0N4U580_DRAME